LLSFPILSPPAWRCTPLLRAYLHQCKELDRCSNLPCPERVSVGCVGCMQNKHAEAIKLNSALVWFENTYPKQRRHKDTKLIW
jgi:hypothetical protein